MFVRLICPFYHSRLWSWHILLVWNSNTNMHPLLLLGHTDKKLYLCGYEQEQLIFMTHKSILEIYRNPKPQHRGSVLTLVPRDAAVASSWQQNIQFMSLQLLWIILTMFLLFFCDSKRLHLWELSCLFATIKLENIDSGMKCYIVYSVVIMKNCCWTFKEKVKIRKSWKENS